MHLPPDVIREALARHVPRDLHLDGFVSTAVLVPLAQTPEGLWIYLTRRQEALSAHAGQICFPGGKRALGDADLAHTALREAQEEIGLEPRDVQLLGALDTVRTRTTYTIAPHVGLIPFSYPFCPHAGEVAELLCYRLAAFREAGRLTVQHVASGDGTTRPVYFYTMEGATVWGATAAIIKQLLERLSDA